MPRTLQPVVAYIWDAENLCDGARLSVSKDEWWDGATVTIEGKMYIQRQPFYDDGSPEPDFEELACGHVQKVRIARRLKYYSNRRRCDACAALGGEL